MLYDTHSHPYLAKSLSQEEILETFFSDDWKYINSIWVDIESSLTSIQLAEKYPWVFASIGIHPTHSLDYIWKLDNTIEKLRQLYRANKEQIVAIWEAGLDYYWLESLSEKYNITKEEIISLQKDFFRAQIWLARELWLPLIIHNREAAQDVLDILKQEDFKNFVFHCYSEDLDYAKELISFAPDCKLGFWWVVTFKNAKATQETAVNIPLRNMIIETDSPYLTPMPYRGKQENRPSFTKYILSHIIDLRKESPEEIQKTIFQNSTQFFSLK